MRFFAGLILLSASAFLHAEEMIEIRYQDSESDGVSYLTRLLVTDRYLRMDQGGDKDDFVLLDRKSGKVVNVQREREMLIVMQNRPLPKASPQHYKIEKKVTPVKEGTVRVQVLADGKQCSETVATRKLFPDAARAMAELNAAMAYTQLATYQSTPADMRQDCELVHLVWHTGLALSQGLPLEARDYSGRVRRYLGGGKRLLKAELFKVPEGYFQFELPAVEEDVSGNNSQPSGVQAK